MVPATLPDGVGVEEEVATGKLVAAATGADDADVDICGTSITGVGVGGAEAGAAAVGEEIEADADGAALDFEPEFAACMSLSDRNSEDVKDGFD